ncbi:AAA family ATPase [Pedobacter sp. JCM 36344]|uniref:AAA family ATPase n=1 Tax=Pedobacter sp. JCM 36344 TaxID=3374280 RepID=UPI00397BB888
MTEKLKLVPGQKAFNAYYNNGLPLTEIAPLSKINFFIGANNSGKSRLSREILKEFYRYPAFDPKNAFAALPEDDKFTFTLREYKSKDIVSLLSNYIQQLVELGATQVTSDLILDLFEGNELIDELQLQNIYMKFHKLNEDVSALKKDEWGLDENETLLKNKQDVLKLIQSILPRIEDLLPLPNNVRFRVNYIPILRTLRSFMAGSHPSHAYAIAKRSDFPKIEGPVIANRIFWDYFAENARADSSQNGKEMLYDGQLQIDNFFTGETLFKKVLELRNDVEHQRNILTKFEDFLSKQFFNGQKVALNAISPQGVDDIYVKIGDEKEYPICQLGDGIQAIILLTFPLYFYGNRTGHILFYEEPELYLHPGMQRIFIEAILAFPNVQVFIATHSNHFLDTSVDYPKEISIFSMEKLITENGEPKFNLLNLSSPDMALLNMLGVRNSSVFLSNCCIWVEGISDRFYIKRYLQMYFEMYEAEGERVFQEDLHFSFMEFGGNNIVHYSFDEAETNAEKILATKVTNKIFLIHDKDAGKEDRHSVLTKQLGKSYYCLDTLEIENLLSPKVLMLTLQDFKLKNASDLEFNDIEQADYAGIPFIEVVGKITELDKLRKIFPDVKPGNTAKLSNKADFARVAVEHMHTWADLSESAQKLTIAVYKFIKSHNNRTI